VADPLVAALDVFALEKMVNQVSCEFVWILRPDSIRDLSLLI